QRIENRKTGWTESSTRTRGLGQLTMRVFIGGIVANFYFTRGCQDLLHLPPVPHLRGLGMSSRDRVIKVWEETPGGMLHGNECVLPVWTSRSFPKGLPSCRIESRGYYYHNSQHYPRSYRSSPGTQSPPRNGTKDGPHFQDAVHMFKCLMIHRISPIMMQRTAVDVIRLPKRRTINWSICPTQIYGETIDGSKRRYVNQRTDEGQ
ncbi:hypothetical protein HAX54_052352, partial [Datura stramonium]|nr:hypothetical protein [Datura stramonium]